MTKKKSLWMQKSKQKKKKGSKNILLFNLINTEAR